MIVSELDVLEPVKEILIAEGIEVLWPPQVEAIKRGALEGKNLVLASPTASGKTLVAELCALKKVLEEGGRVLYLTPLRALAAEKYQEFKKYEKLEKPSGKHIAVAISTGDCDSSDPWLGRYDIVICTNEKADSLLRHGARWLDEVSLIIADEVHLLNYADRGPTLEMALTRLREINPSAQILALSATVRNAEEIANWIGGEVVTTDWRPVKLKEGVVLADGITFNDGTSEKIRQAYKDPVTNLALQIIQEGGQALIFVETRRRAISMAKKVAPAVRKTLTKAARRRLKEVANEVLETGEKTRLGEVLAHIVSQGVAFHHAGLNPAHRRILEDRFREGLIRVMTATPTLAFGVNLPARLVVISSYMRYEPGYGSIPISILEYKQMAGRAGRPKYDQVGEAVLIAKSPDEQDFLMHEYVCAEYEKIWSKLGAESVLRSHVLATIASGFAYTERGLIDFFSKTFYAYQYGPELIKGPIAHVLRFLRKEGMINARGKRFVATNFGRRVSELYIDPISAVMIRDGLLRARRFDEFGFLHMVCRTPDMSPKYYPRRKELDRLRLYLEERKDHILFDVPEEWEDPVAFQEVLAEVKMALVLESWMNEDPEDRILEFHEVEPGDLYRLVETAEWLLYASRELARLFGRNSLLPSLHELQERVKFGVKRELIPLASLRGIGRVRARSLFNAGYRTIEDLKRADIGQLIQVPTIGLRVAKQIKEQVGGLVRKEEWESTTNIEQLHLTDLAEQ